MHSYNNIWYLYKLNIKSKLRSHKKFCFRLFNIFVLFFFLRTLFYWIKHFAFFIFILFVSLFPFFISSITPSFKLYIKWISSFKVAILLCLALVTIRHKTVFAKILFWNCWLNNNLYSWSMYLRFPLLLLFDVLGEHLITKHLKTITKFRIPFEHYIFLNILKGSYISLTNNIFRCSHNVHYFTASKKYHGSFVLSFVICCKKIKNFMEELVPLNSCSCF